MVTQPFQRSTRGRFCGGGGGVDGGLALKGGEGSAHPPPPSYTSSAALGKRLERFMMHSTTTGAAPTHIPAPSTPPLCDIPSGCCSFTGPWTVTLSSLRMWRRVAAFCRPLRPVLLRCFSPQHHFLSRWCWDHSSLARSPTPVLGLPVPASTIPLQRWSNALPLSSPALCPGGGGGGTSCWTRPLPDEDPPRRRGRRGRAEKPEIAIYCTPLPNYFEPDHPLLCTILNMFQGIL